MIITKTDHNKWQNIATTKAVIIPTVNSADLYHQDFKFQGWNLLLINNIIKAILMAKTVGCLLLSHV